MSYALLRTYNMHVNMAVRLLWQPRPLCQAAAAPAVTAPSSHNWHGTALEVAAVAPLGPSASAGWFRKIARCRISAIMLKYGSQRELLVSISHKPPYVSLFFSCCLSAPALYAIGLLEQPWLLGAVGSLMVVYSAVWSSPRPSAFWRYVSLVSVVPDQHLGSSLGGVRVLPFACQ